jgi:hypothetical protein
MAQSETAAEASSYHQETPRQDSVGTCRKDDEPLIDFSPDTEEPKHNLHSHIT